MSIKSKVVAVAAALTLFGGVGAASALTAGPASAATPSCGFTCIQIYNQQFGQAFYQDTFQQNARLGQQIILFRSSDSDPALDFTVTDIAYYSNCPGGVEVVKNPTPPPTYITVPCTGTGPFPVPYTVGQLCAAGVPLGPGTCIQYPYDLVYEVQYSPYGVNSNLCVGVAAGNVSGEGVTLQPCGLGPNTWWVADAGHAYISPVDFKFYTPWVNAASANFTQPLVLTYPTNGYPTDKPRPQLFVSTERTFSSNAPYQQQMWGLCIGEVGLQC